MKNTGLENQKINIVTTPERFYEQMKNYKEIAESGKLILFGAEEMHQQMDELMCEILCSLGYEKGIEVFRNTQKWYSL